MATFLPTVTVTDAKGETCTYYPNDAVVLNNEPLYGSSFSVQPTVICEGGFVLNSAVIPGDFVGDPVNFTLQDMSGQNINGFYGTGVTGGVAPYSYAWNFGDGTSGASDNVAHSYTSPGFYCVQLTATDSQGNTSEWLSTVDISSAQSSPTPNSGAQGTTEPTLQPSSTAYSSSEPLSSKNSSLLNQPMTLLLLTAAVAIIVAISAIAVSKNRKKSRISKRTSQTLTPMQPSQTARNEAQPMPSSPPAKAETKEEINKKEDQTAESAVNRPKFAFCPNCGKQLPITKQYCPFCGNHLFSDSSP
jgi:hypothetical protein